MLDHFFTYNHIRLVKKHIYVSNLIKKSTDDLYKIKYVLIVIEKTFIIEKWHNIYGNNLLEKDI